MFKRSAGYLAVAALAVALVAGCDTSKLTDALDDFNVVIGLDSVNTTVSGQFLDARTGELIDQPITVTFSGANANDVIDMFSKPLDRQEIDGGLVSFGLSNTLNPTPSSPAKVNVIAESDGYISTGRTVTVTSEGETTFNLYMVDPDNPPEGSTVRNEEEGEAGSDGSVQQGISVSSGSEAQTNANATVNVNQGTVLTDADGGALSGNLTTTMGYYNNSSDKSMKSFPGEVVAADGQDLVTAGFTSIEIRDAGGRKAANFSSPIQLATEIPGNMFNPLTGQTVKAGDEIDIYSYDTRNAEWVNEGSATVQGPKSNGNFFVEYQADHLSYWGLFFPGVPTCTSGATLTINRNGNTGPLGATIMAEGFSKQVTIPAGVNSISIPDDLSLESVPDLEADVTIVTDQGSVTETGNLCSGSYTIDLPQPPADQVDVTMDVQLQCPAADEYVRVTTIPTATVKYRRSNATEGLAWNSVNDLAWEFNEDENRLEGGSFTAQGVTDGSAYDFRIYFDGDTYKREDITLNAPTTSYTEEVSGDNCS